MIDNARSVKIVVESTEEEFDTKLDWGLYIQNTDCIGEVKQQTNYITIPGSNVQVDLSEALVGRPVYISREIKIELAGIRQKYGWDTVLSDFRNKINGQVCRFIFSDDADYFWRGRPIIKDTSTEISVGHLTIYVPDTEPYKYSVFKSNDRWLWDTFSFLTGVIFDETSFDVDGTKVVILPFGNMPVVPDFLVEDSINLKVRYQSIEKNLFNGMNRDPRILVNGDVDTVLTFTGRGKVDIIYRRGSL